MILLKDDSPHGIHLVLEASGGRLASTTSDSTSPEGIEETGSAAQKKTWRATACKI